MTTEATQLTTDVRLDLGQDFLVVESQDEGPVNWVRYSDGSNNTLCDFDLRSCELKPSPVPRDECPGHRGPPSDRVSIRRRCTQCGQPYYEVSEDPASGPVVRKGDTIVVPAIIVRNNLNLTNGASFTRQGVDWLARELFSAPVGLFPNADGFELALSQLAAEAESILTGCPLVRHIDRTEEEGFENAARILNANATDPAFSALVLKTKAEYVVDQLDGHADSASKTLAMAAWSAGAAAALLRFKIHCEEAAYRGNSLESIRWLLSEWQRNQRNESELFWQQLLLSRPFALTQLFSAPVVIHGDSFLVGGIRAGGRHGKISDYLLRNQLTDAAAIVELKTPVTCLLNRSEYRQDVFVPSSDLSGAIQQALEQRAQFMKHMQMLQAELEPDEPRLEIVEPHCVVVLGSTVQLGTRARKRSFEMYRSELRNVRVVTYDELFAKLNGLVGLLGGTDRSSST